MADDTMPTSRAARRGDQASTASVLAERSEASQRFVATPSDLSAHPPSDEELTRQALAARPDPPVPADALPFQDDRVAGPELLPDWYMPRPAGGRTTPARRAVALALVAAALVINGMGFCLTYGQLTAG